MAKDSKGHGSDKRGMRGGADYTPDSPGPGFAGTRATKTRLQAESDAYMKKHAKKSDTTTYRPGDKPGRTFNSYAEMAAYRESKEDYQRKAHNESRAVRATTQNKKY